MRGFEQHSNCWSAAFEISNRSWESSWADDPPGDGIGVICVWEPPFDGTSHCRFCVEYQPLYLTRSQDLCWCFTMQVTYGPIHNYLKNWSFVAAQIMGVKEQMAGLLFAWLNLCSNWRPMTIWRFCSWNWGACDDTKRKQNSKVASTVILLYSHLCGGICLLAYHQRCYRRKTVFKDSSFPFHLVLHVLWFFFLGWGWFVTASQKSYDDDDLEIHSANQIPKAPWKTPSPVFKASSFSLPFSS